MEYLINDEFTLGRNKYKIFERSYNYTLCENIEGEIVSISHEEYPILTEKKEDNNLLLSLYEFIKSEDSSYLLDDDIIYNDYKKIRFVNLLKYSELFKTNKYLYDDTSDIIIFEDEYRDKKEIVESRIRNLLGKSITIYARKCEIREVEDNNLLRDFLDKSHIQGFVGSKIKLGLFYNNELISLMTFGNLRRNMGKVSKEGSYELLRFCNSLNTSVVGGASKLFKYFMSVYKPEYILSFADRRWSNGDMYFQLGFEFKNNTVPNYFYIINGNRGYRYAYRKDILVKKGFDPNKTELEIMTERGHFRIFDRGSVKFEYFIE
jgi:hypothetical protein